jgi:hypothetical protein
MSRAFVKDAEDKPDDLPDRPISPHHNLVTEAGPAAIDAALARFEAGHAATTAKGKRKLAPPHCVTGGRSLHPSTTGAPHRPRHQSEKY